MLAVRVLADKLETIVADDTLAVAHLSRNALHLVSGSRVMLKKHVGSIFTEIGPFIVAVDRPGYRQQRPICYHPFMDNDPSSLRTLTNPHAASKSLIA